MPGEPVRQVGRHFAFCVLVLAVSATALGAPDPAAPSARAVIRSLSKDPDSLKFRNEFDSHSIAGIKCGEVNGKNGFGGYVGFRRFIVQREKALVDDGTLPKFNQAWLELCSKKK